MYVGVSVLKEKEVALPCSYRSTCLLQGDAFGVTAFGGPAPGEGRGVPQPASANSHLQTQQV